MELSVTLQNEGWNRVLRCEPKNRSVETIELRVRGNRMGKKIENKKTFLFKGKSENSEKAWGQSPSENGRYPGMGRSFLSVILLLVILGSLLVTGCEKSTTKETDMSGKIQLLSFENYEEITGTKVRTENQLGKVSFVTDSEFVTEGTASMKIEVQGDYSRSSVNPYMQFECDFTTFGTSNFTDIESVSLDVYNASDEALSVTLYFKAGNFNREYESTTAVSYKIQPGEWTTCTYDIEKNWGDLDLTDVRYFFLVFNEHKTAKAE